jgi:hypothetical protein
LLTALISVTSVAHSDDGNYRFGSTQISDKPQISALYGGDLYSVDIGKQGVLFQTRTHSISVNMSEDDKFVELEAWSEGGPMDYSFLNVIEAPEYLGTEPPSFGKANQAIFIDGQLYSGFESPGSHGGAIQCTAGAAAQLAAAALGVVAACSGPQATVACAAALANYVAASIAWNVACAQE